MKMFSKNIYVLKGYKKLRDVIKNWPIPFINFIGLDIGTSVGGFTYVLLEDGAKKIYAIDVGRSRLCLNVNYNQKIHIDNLEKSHINIIDNNYFHPKPQIIVIDVSFISVLNIVQYISCYASSIIRLYILVKPQFEVFVKLIRKNGIIKNRYVQKMALLNILYYILNISKKSIVDFYLFKKSKNLEYWVVSEY